MIETELNGMITFKIEEFYSEGNGWDKKKVHPRNMIVRIEGRDGGFVECNLMNLIPFIGMLNEQYENPGKLMDHLYCFLEGDEESILFMKKRFMEGMFSNKGSFSTEETVGWLMVSPVPFLFCKEGFELNLLKFHNHAVKSINEME